MSNGLQRRGVPLGSTGERMFPVGQGTNGFGSRLHHDAGAVRARQDAISAGIERGITLVDTAEMYGGGFAEECLAPVLEGRRDQVFLATKFSPRRRNPRAAVLESLEGSLKRLGTDHVDLFQLHHPDPGVPASELLAGMADAVAQGKARFLGVSNVTCDELAQARACLGGALVSVQVEYSPFDRSAEDVLLPWAAAHAVTVLAYSPLGHGSLHFSVEATAELLDVCRRCGCTLHQLVLRWVIRHAHVIALTKSSNSRHQAENAAAADVELSPEDQALVDRHLRYLPDRVSPARIRPDSETGRATYRTLEEAERNRLQLVPSPADVASLVRAGHAAKPIRLVTPREPEAAFTFEPYDHFGELRKYWSWIMVHGPERPMPAIILPRKDHDE